MFFNFFWRNISPKKIKKHKIDELCILLSQGILDQEKLRLQDC